MSEINETENAVVFENVKFSYPGAEGVYAVNGVSLTVKRGEFLSVIGHNGSGKSTLARLTNGLLEADSGKITVLGLDVSEDKNPLEIRKHVGIVFQNPDNQMVASIVEDDVAFGPENIGIKREEIGERIDWALKAVGMEEYRRSTPTRLSGGQKQRISIARALAKKNPILVLDDSTSALDMETEQMIQDTLRTLDHTTKIIIAHRISSVMHADEIIVLENGSIHERGTHASLMAQKGLYYETYAAQYQGGETHAR